MCGSAPGRLPGRDVTHSATGAGASTVWLSGMPARGLAAGATRCFAELGRQPRFVFAEPAGSPSLKESLAGGKRVKLAKVDNFVDGAAVAEIGREPFRHLKDFPADAVQLIPENRLCATIIEMLNVEGVVLEPAGALASRYCEYLTDSTRSVGCLWLPCPFDVHQMRLESPKETVVGLLAW